MPGSEKKTVEPFVLGATQMPTGCTYVGLLTGKRMRGDLTSSTVCRSLSFPEGRLPELCIKHRELEFGSPELEPIIQFCCTKSLQLKKNDYSGHPGMVIHNLDYLQQCKG